MNVFKTTVCTYVRICICQRCVSEPYSRMDGMHLADANFCLCQTYITVMCISIKQMCILDMYICMSDMCICITEVYDTFISVYVRHVQDSKCVRLRMSKSTYDLQTGRVLSSDENETTL